MDRACIQFEPDDPRYIEIICKTYDHIAANDKFDLLRSTRHFGPMAFYLAWEGRIDSLLQDMIKRQMIEDAAHLVNLYYLVNPSEKRQKIDLPSTDHLSTIKVLKYFDYHFKFSNLLIIDFLIQRTKFNSNSFFLSSIRITLKVNARKGTKSKLVFEYTKRS